MSGDETTRETTGAETMTTQTTALDTATDTPRPTLRHLTIPGCEAESWVLESAYHGSTEVISIVPATGDDGWAGWDVIGRVGRSVDTLDWGDDRAEMVESARELADARLVEMTAEWEEWVNAEDEAA